MRVKFPIKNHNAKSIYRINEEGYGGWYPLGINNKWHGGVNINFPDKNHKTCAVRAIADGTIVAYRATQSTCVFEKTFLEKEEQVPFLKKICSNNFVLIKHTIDGGDTPIEFYSLYMHLLPFGEYKDKYEKGSISVFNQFEFSIKTKEDGAHGMFLISPCYQNIETTVPMDTYVRTKKEPDMDDLPESLKQGRASFQKANSGGKHLFKYLEYIDVQSKAPLLGYGDVKKCCKKISATDDQEVYRVLSRNFDSGSKFKPKRGLNVRLKPHGSAQVIDILPKGKKVYFENPEKVCDKNGTIKPGYHALDPGKHLFGNPLKPDETGLKGYIYCTEKTLHKTNIGTQASDEIRNVNLDVKAGQVIGWPGSDGVSETTLHLEVFTKDSAFLSQPELAGLPKILKIASGTQVSILKKQHIQHRNLPENTVLELQNPIDSVGKFPTENSRKIKPCLYGDGWVLRGDLKYIKGTGSNPGEAQYTIRGNSLKWIWSEPARAMAQKKRDLYIGLRKKYNGNPVKLTLVEMLSISDDLNLRRVSYQIPENDCSDFTAWVKNEAGLEGVVYKVHGNKTCKYLVTDPDKVILYDENPEVGNFYSPRALPYNQDIFIKESDCKKQKDSEGKIWIGIPQGAVNEGQVMIYPEKGKEEAYYWIKRDDPNITEVNPFSCFTKVESSDLRERELYCTPTSLFERIDTNGNGRIDQDEIEKAVKKSPARFYLRFGACKHTSDWYFDPQKWDVLRTATKPFNLGPQDKYDAFLEIDEKMTFLHKVDGFSQGEELCHFHPIAFVEHLRKLFYNPVLRFPLNFIPSASYKTGSRMFGSNRDDGERKHAGCDLYAPEGTPIFALQDGTVIKVYDFYMGTKAIEVDHGKFIARYGEVSGAKDGIEEGVQVRRGQHIGFVGSLTFSNGNTMSMLHLELYSGVVSGNLTDYNNSPFYRRSDLLNPTLYLDKAIID